jgi:hypothetical protein
MRLSGELSRKIISIDRSIIRSHRSLRMNDIHFSSKANDVTSRAILASGSSLHLSQEGDSAP